MQPADWAHERQAWSKFLGEKSVKVVIYPNALMGLEYLPTSSVMIYDKCR